VDLQEVSGMPKTVSRCETIDIVMNYNQHATISLPVADLKKSERWYCDVLGLTTTTRLNDPPWCELQTPVPGLSVGLAEVDKVRVGDSMLTLTVVDVDVARDQLLDKGADVSEIVNIGDITRVVSVMDPDGHTVMLREGTL
jgi:catechol 2,3-dioxygenase-like lactoylglutathione lyase family enzyme